MLPRGFPGSPQAHTIVTIVNQARTIKAVGVETMVKAILYECERERVRERTRVGGIATLQHVIRGKKEIKKKKR